MYNNPYYNQNNYINDLQNMRDRIDKQMQQFQQQNIKQPTPTNLTQNFQLAPNNNSNGIKYVNSIEDVKKELVFSDTLFVNKEFNNLWLKNVSGDIKTYKLEQVIELDDKDLKINELLLKIENLEKEMKNYESNVNDNTNVNASTSKQKSSDVSNYKSSNAK